MLAQQRTLAAIVLAAIAGAPSDSFAQSAGRRPHAGSKTRLERLLEGERGSQPGQTVSDTSVTLGATGGQADWEFPQDSMRWLNSPPLTAESLAGKGVLLVFFEEECPACAAKWPDLLKLAAEYTQRPVLFIAVNSGNPPRVVNEYARQQRITWPVIADVDRSFETAMGVPEVSLSNVIQVRYVTADGLAHAGKWSDLAGTAEAALEGAAWRVAPPAPRKLQRAWRAVELGRYAEASRDVLRYADESGGGEQEFAAALLAAVNEAINADYKEAGSAYSDERYWDAYKQLDGLTERYEGYELPPGVEPAIKKLRKRDDVAAQIKAKSSLEKAIRTASKGSDGAIRRGIGMLERLVSASPETEAAGEAEKILAKFNR